LVSSCHWINRKIGSISAGWDDWYYQGETGLLYDNGGKKYRSLE
jgi:hypothetical protein